MTKFWASIMLLAMLASFGCTKPENTQKNTVEPTPATQAQVAEFDYNQLEMYPIWDPRRSENQKRKTPINYLTLEEFSIHSERFSKPVEFGIKQFPDHTSREEYLRNDFDKVNWLEVYKHERSSGADKFYIDGKGLQNQKEVNTDQVFSVRVKFLNAGHLLQHGEMLEFRSYGSTHIIDINCKSGQILSHTGATLENEKSFSPVTFQDYVAWGAPDFVEQKIVDFVCK